MCGRFTQERPASDLAEIFGAEPLVDDPGGVGALVLTELGATVDKVKAAIAKDTKG